MDEDSVSALQESIESIAEAIGTSATDEVLVQELDEIVAQLRQINLALVQLTQVISSR